MLCGRSLCLNLILSCTFILSIAHPAHAGRGEVVYDVSGRPGESDADGYSHPQNSDPGQNSDGSGRTGERGGDAVENPKKHGQSAGSLQLVLSYEAPARGGRGQVAVGGTRTSPDSRRTERIQDIHDLTDGLAIRARANAGPGGNGGDGGRGQPGGRGRDGRDAYHMGTPPVVIPVPGEDGRPGGRGGDSGNPTSGGNAGQAGRIEIETSIFNTDLAMLVREMSVDGARGGTAGRALGPGPGGAGGSGGSSDTVTWQVQVGTRDITEPVYEDVTEEVTETYDITNSQGEVVGTGTRSAGTRVVGKRQTGTRKIGEEPIYAPRSSFAPGGSDASNGSAGQNSRAVVRNGNDAAPGEVSYIVVDENGRRTQYQGFYSLILQPDYELEGDLNKNGFFEPGEKVRIRGIKVTNNGLAPTPKYQKIKIFIKDSGDWIRSQQVELELPVVLMPGESHTFTDQALEFLIQERQHSGEGALESTARLSPSARVPRVEREFENFAGNARTTLRIRYPIELKVLQAVDALAPGEVSRILIEVTNVSTQTIGAVKGRQLRRGSINLHRAGGTTDDSEVVILPTAEAQLVDTAIGWTQHLAGLKPGKSVIMEVLVGVGNDAVPYTNIDLHPRLFLQSPVDADRDSQIQVNPISVRVSQKFQHSEGADILLIANSKLDQKVLEAMRWTAKSKGLEMDVFDFSLYGFFNLRQNTEKWGSFFDAYRNKTVIIMGNAIKTPAGTIYVQNLLSPDDVIEAGRRYGIRFVIMDTSGDAPSNVANLIAPQVVDPQSVGSTDYSSAQLYVKELAAEVKRFDEEIGGDVRHDLGYSNVSVTTKVWGSGEPSLDILTTAAAQLLRAVQAVAPEVAIYIEQHPNLQQESGGLRKRWSVGELRIRRSVDIARNSVVSIPMKPSEISNPNFIMDNAFQAAFDEALQLDTKLKLIGSILRGEFTAQAVPAGFRSFQPRSPLEFAEILLNSVQREIMHEQLTIRPYGEVFKVSREAIWNKLDTLTRVADYNYGETSLRPDSPHGKLWLKLITDLWYFSQDSVTRGQRAWSYTLGRVFGRSPDLQVTDVTNELVERLIKNVFDDSLVEDIKAEVKAAAKAMREQNNNRRARAVLEHHNFQNMAGHGLIRNGEIQIVSNRILTEADQEALRRQTAEREALAAQVRAGYEAEAATLKLSPEACAIILERRRGRQ